MDQLTIVVLLMVMLMVATNGQYPDCVDCSESEWLSSMCVCVCICVCACACVCACICACAHACALCVLCVCTHVYMHVSVCVCVCICVLVCDVTIPLLQFFNHTTGTGSIPLSPLSYNTLRSQVFNGTQPSNEGCTNSVSIDEQVTIDCGQGTTLIDCDRGYNDNADYSDLSDYFIWNRTASVAQQVSIVFRFDQQISISRISMFFWNSQSNSIIVPNVMMYWSNDDSITPSNVIIITPGSPNRDGDGRCRFNININRGGLQFQYLRIVMSFYDNSEWIFLSDVQFCGE